MSLIITLLSSLERENIVQSNDAASHPNGLYSAVRINKAEETRTIRFLNLFPTQVRAIEVSIGSKTKEAKLIHYLERRGILGSYAGFAGRIPAQARTERNLKQKILQHEDFQALKLLSRLSNETRMKCCDVGLQVMNQTEENFCKKYGGMLQELIWWQIIS